MQDLLGSIFEHHDADATAPTTWQQVWLATSIHPDNPSLIFCLPWSTDRGSFDHPVFESVPLNVRHGYVFLGVGHWMALPAIAPEQLREQLQPQELRRIRKAFRHVFFEGHEPPTEEVIFEDWNCPGRVYRGTLADMRELNGEGGYANFVNVLRIQKDGCVDCGLEGVVEVVDWRRS